MKVKGSAGTGEHREVENRVLVPCFAGKVFDLGVEEVFPVRQKKTIGLGVPWAGKKKLKKGDTQMVG